MNRVSVFATVGTDHHQFDRLSDWIDAAAERVDGVDIFMQAGTSRPPAIARSEPFMSYEDVMEMMSGADIIVCHGGPATIVEARAAGRLPIVVPREPQYDEIVDGHQVRFARWMAEREQVRLATTRDEFLAVLVAEKAVAESGDSSVLADPLHVPDGVRRFDELVTSYLQNQRAPRSLPSPRAKRLTAALRRSAL